MEGQGGVVDLEDVKVTTMQIFLTWLYSGWVVISEEEAEWILKGKKLQEQCDSSDKSSNESSSEFSDDFTEPDEEYLKKQAKKVFEKDDSGERHVDPDNPVLEKYLEKHPRALEELYIFAGQFEVPNLRKHIIDSLYKFYTRKGKLWTPMYAGIIVAFNNLPASSPLCKFYIDLHVLRGDTSVPNDEENQVQQFLPPAFLNAIMTGMGEEKRMRKARGRRYKSPSMKVKEEYYEKADQQVGKKRKRGASNESESDGGSAGFLT